MIPYDGDTGLPEVYQYIIECKNELKNYDKNKKFCAKNYTSKKSNELFKKPYEIKSNRSNTII